MIKALLRFPSLLFTFSFLLFTSNAYADSLGTTKVSYSTGEKSQTDDIEERDLSGNFSYRKYGLMVKAEPSPGFRYKAGLTTYKKDFDAANNNLDNRTNIYNTSLSLPVYKTVENSFRLNTDYQLRSKRYKNSPTLEYDQNNLSGGIDIDFDKNYLLEFSGGIQDYDYIENSASNQLKSFFKLAPSIKNERLTVSGFYKRGWVDQSGGKKDYTEDSASIRTTLNLNQLPSPLWGFPLPFRGEGQGEGYRFPLPYKLAGHFGYGRNDTRESEEDREDNLRFEYRLWDIASYCSLNKAIDAKFSYGQKHRDYFTSINSYENWFIENETKLELFKKESFNLDLLLGAEHKETKFYVNEDVSYKKGSLSGGFNILKREDFSFKPAFKFTRYDYPPGSTSNQKSYKANLSLKKYIGTTDKALEAGCWYKWKDYEFKSDSEQWTMSLSFELRF